MGNERMDFHHEGMSVKVIYLFSYFNFLQPALANMELRPFVSCLIMNVTVVTAEEKQLEVQTKVL